MRYLLIGLLVTTACFPAGQPTSSAISVDTPPTLPPPSLAPVITLPDLGVEVCDPPDVVIPQLPEGLAAENVDISRLATDRFTTIPGSSVAFWADIDGEISMAFVRGSLPTEPWTGSTERVQVRGYQAALGPLSDGVWAVAWFESETTCGSYTLLFYPPLGADDARQVAESIREP